MATSPDGGALDLVLMAIDSAKTSIRLAAYEFSSKAIVEALQRNQMAGGSILVVLDKSQFTDRYTSAPLLASAGIPVRINSRYAVQHSKIMVIDGDSVETGSFNFTTSAAKRNSENVLLVWHHPALAKQYSVYWQRLWEESEPYAAH
jgi:phosphatidylserine/phosphatidylglycerophosphate/cardiolipin synthase-like enzyme